MPTKKQVEEKIKIFEKQNGSLNNFSIKEIIVMLHKETQGKIAHNNEKIDDLTKKIEKQMDWANQTLKEGYGELAERDQMIAKIMESLPAKGFCENVTNALELDKKITLHDKMEILWNDRRWIKAILIVLTGTMGATVINILWQIFKG